jgi:Fe-S cluster assembly scaffold protein SufB
MIGRIAIRSATNRPLILANFRLLLFVAALLFRPAARAWAWTTVAPWRRTVAAAGAAAAAANSKTKLGVSIGLGPQKDEQQQQTAAAGAAARESALVPGEDYEVPDHEAYRTSRRSKFDERCDRWFAQLLVAAPYEEDSPLSSPSEELEAPEATTPSRDRVRLGCLGSVAENALDAILTPVPLVNDLELQDKTDPDWTPYVSTRLPWTPLTPAYGLEAFGLPVPRRGAEAWRQFDVNGLVSQPYRYRMAMPQQWRSLREDTSDEGSTTTLCSQIRSVLDRRGSWLPDDACRGRLVYVNGEFVPALSKTTPDIYNLQSCPEPGSDLRRYLGRLTDGHSDELLAVDQPGISEPMLSRLSGPNHRVGPPTSQFAINTQQGTACFAALNTVQISHVAVVRSSAASPNPPHEDPALPVLVVQAFTLDAGIAVASSRLEAGTSTGSATSEDSPSALGNVRVLAMAEAGTRLSLHQCQVDLDLDVGSENELAQAHHVPKLVNSYTQIMVHESANVTYSLLEQLGGLVTPNVEVGDDDEDNVDEPESSSDESSPRQKEADRPGLRDAIFNTIDAHVWRDGHLSYAGVQMGGSGKDRLAASVSLLQQGSGATVSGFSLSGGAQRCETKTLVHHVSPDTYCQQVQKNLVGGRSTASFRGRIRVEQDAQRTDARQLSRSILLTDKSRAWSVPSLEIVADDVKCSHGTTVSDLSEEELFYLTSRGIGRTTARKLLMYAFASDVCASVDPVFQDRVREQALPRLENLVPKGGRAVRGEYQSI